MIKVYKLVGIVHYLHVVIILSLPKGSFYMFIELNTLQQ